MSFHYYGLPEQIPQYHVALHKVMARHGLAHLPVWNTEFGYLIEDPSSPNTHPLIGGAFSRVLPAAEAAAWLARSLIIAASFGIERFYWHMWDGRNMGLVTFKGRRINAAGVAYGTVAGWLTDRRIEPLQQSGNLVVCPIAENGKAWGGPSGRGTTPKSAGSFRKAGGRPRCLHWMAGRSLLHPTRRSSCRRAPC